MSVLDERAERQTILIVDDSAMNRALLADMLGEGYRILEAENGTEALKVLHDHVGDISLVLLDIVMPEMDGIEVLRVMNANGWTREIPVVMVTSETAADTVERAYELGAADFINRPFDTNIVRRRVMNTIMLYAKQKVLVGMVADQVYERERTTNLMISILGHIVEFRNGESGLHVQHVNIITEMLLERIAQKTDRYDLTPERIALITMTSSLHDIGKIAIPEAILNKPGRLTDDEFALMKTHAAIGAEMLVDLPVDAEEPLLKTAYEICRWHHERYDGHGYPDGLVADAIPISAQVVALADVYDALTSERVYKAAIPHDEAIRMIMNGECGAFDPFLLECLVEIGPQLQERLAASTLLANYPEATVRASISDSVTRSLAPSSRTLDLLDYERMKYQFFASMSNEIQFEYTADSNVLIFTDCGAHGSMLPEVVSDPMHDETLKELFGAESMEVLAQAIHATTPEDPIIHEDFEAPMDGSPRWFHLDARAIWSEDEDAQLIGCIGKLIDIHEERSIVSDLRHKALHDPLTDLANKAYARQLVEDVMEQARRQGSRAMLMVVDLDLFKDANDSRGHQFGDDVLRFFAKRLRESVRDGDAVARVGGDEFLVCMVAPEDPKPLVERIYSFVTCVYDGFPISVSMGIALTAPASGDETEEPTATMRDAAYDDLFRRADLALYETKERGRNGFTFASSLSDANEAPAEKTALSAIDAESAVADERR